MFCKTCNKDLASEDEYIVFCDKYCQRAYFEITERKISMRHPFVSLIDNKTMCSTCNYNVMDHTAMAKCKVCGATTLCDLVEGDLLCANCEKDCFVPRIEVLRTADAVITEARKIDNSITYNGEFYNARVTAIAEIARAINLDDSIPPEEKSYKLQNVLAEKYQHLKDVVFNLDKQKHDAVVEQIVITKTLRDMGNDLRKEIQEKIKSLDQNYTPIRNTSVIARVPKSKLSPFESIVQQLALGAGISLEAARQKLIDGGLSHVPKKDG